MRQVLFSAIAIALAGFVLVPATSAAASAIRTTTQLPRDVRPSHYDVTIRPDASNLRFNGDVTVDIDVLQATRSIALNAIDLAFSNASLASLGGKVQPITATIAVDDAAQI
ncbi:MAG: M1 family peptidase, partial [Lysobacteraceae bacterium]